MRSFADILKGCRDNGTLLVIELTNGEEYGINSHVKIIELGTDFVTISILSSGGLGGGKIIPLSMIKSIYPKR